MEDCRKLADERGWVVAEKYVDNDVSAYSGKTRPAYRRMLADLAAGERDAVIVYNLDRLHRQPATGSCGSSQYRPPSLHGP